MDENEITQRLRDAGRNQVPGDVRNDHLTRMHAGVPVVGKQKRFGRLAVAAAAFVGFAVGSTGFAMAGALPAPAQQVAHDVLSVVQVNVKDPKANHGQCVSAAMKDLDPTTSDEARKAAKDAACPKSKPAHAGQGKDKAKGRPDHAGTPGGPKAKQDDGDPCTGPPPWAGKGGKGLSAEAKAQAKADRQAARASCPPDDDDDDPEDPAAEAAEREREAAEDAAEREQEAAEDAADDEQDAAESPVDAPQGQGRAPEESPAGPPAEGAPGQQDEPGTPPVEVPEQPTQETPAG